ncbi:MAG: YkgJ family cysteine cluster protein [Phycisphaerales bacterium]|nr:MAG: YkgJ family cysteine cluster protein [Phycisphaerales bacterium]
MVQFGLDVLGEQMQFSISAEQEQMKLADIVPWARTVCDSVTARAVHIRRRNGGHIACKKGCSSCCCYLVPLSVPEAFRLRREVGAMPASEGQRAEQSCLLAARRILESPIPDLFTGESLQEFLPSNEEIDTVSEWYRSLELYCPFLDGGICSIYGQRPLCCREYFIDGSAAACKGESEDAAKVEVPVRMSEVLARLVAELQGRNVEAIMMPLALIWADENQVRDHKTWSTLKIAERFVELLEEMVEDSFVAVVS